jgi:hypothetical protein
MSVAVFAQFMRGGIVFYIDVYDSNIHEGFGFSPSDIIFNLLLELIFLIFFLKYLGFVSSNLLYLCWQLAKYMKST